MFEKRTARITSLVLMVCGALFAGMGIGLYVRAWRMAETVEQGASRARAACLETLRGLGTLTSSEAGMRLVVPDVTDPHQTLADTSVVLAACPDWTLSYFCMGKGCASGGTVAMVVDLTQSR